MALSPSEGLKHNVLRHRRPMQRIIDTNGQQRNQRHEEKKVRQQLRKRAAIHKIGHGLTFVAFVDVVAHKN